MTKEHFIAIAATIRALDVDYMTRMDIAVAMADTCGEFNDLFDHDKFIKAATD